MHGNNYPLRIAHQEGLDGEKPHVVSQDQLNYSLTNSTKTLVGSNVTSTNHEWVILISGFELAP
jgi:hypothetical protein